MHSVLKSFLVILALVLPMQSVQAQSAKQAEPSGKPAFALINSMTAFREQYISKLLQVIRANGGADLVLEEKDLSLKAKVAAANIRSRAVSKLLSYDLNNDGEVTAGEVKLKLTQFYGGSVRRILRTKNLTDKKLFKSDLNGDGKVTIAEVLKSSTQNQTRRSRLSLRSELPRKILALDPNGDKRLTMIELEQLGRAAFAFYDTDDDGTLSAKEFKALSLAKREYRSGRIFRQPSKHIADNCRLPKAQKK